ncbi:unnamed protein product [Mytilus coruscus]|uniref:Uncharacterized protein n=1 Tax=Mytilus coruscus TaxID=42192 RepID=A0A6J8AV62_MYTCO|nr:unnamed protein product [Mytilus coruscus]
MSVNGFEDEETCLLPDNNSNRASSTNKLLNSICELFLFLLYLLTLREQIGLCIFLLRSLCYSIIFGLIAPDFVMRCFIIVIASLGYFLSYVLNYIDLYSFLLQLVFTIQAETKTKKDEANQKAESVSSAMEQNGGANQEVESESSTIEQNGGANQEVESINSTIEQNGGVNQEVGSVSSTIEQNGGANQEVESLNSTIEQNDDVITEALFNYIVDNCSIVKRSLFLSIVKTFMTCIFLTVTLLILRDTGKLQDLNLNEIVTFLVVLISPKVVSIFTAYKTEYDIERHKGEVEKLIEEFNTINESSARYKHTGKRVNAYVFFLLFV